MYAHHKGWLQAVFCAVMPDKLTLIPGILFEVNFCSTNNIHTLQEEHKRESTPRYLALNRALSLSDSYPFQHASQNLIANIFANKLSSQKLFGLFSPTHVHFNTRIYKCLTLDVKPSTILLKSHSYTLFEIIFLKK